MDPRRAISVVRTGSRRMRPRWPFTFRFGRLDLAIAIYGVLTTYAAVAYLSTALGRPIALLSLVTIPLAVLLRNRPALSAMAMVAGATVLRISHAGLFMSEPLELARLASERMMTGSDPYGGFVYATGSAYSHGPLGLVTYRAGVVGECIAAIGTGALLAWRRAWITLAIFNSVPLFVFTAVNGATDHSPAFLIVASLLLIRRHPNMAVAVLAAATAVKPYAAAWLFPAIGFAGWAPALVGLVAMLLLWGPALLLWGPTSFLASIFSVEIGRLSAVGSVHASWALDVPSLRLLAAPVSFAGLAIRSWRWTLLVGSASFVLFLGFAPWAHFAYFVPLLPIVGLALEDADPSPPLRSKAVR